MRSRIVVLTLVAALGVAAPATAAEDRGEFQVEWGSLTAKANDNGKFQKGNRRAARIVKRSGAMEAVVAEVNRRWALPVDVPIFFSDALQDGPAYLSDLDLGDGEPVSFINMPGGFLTLQLRLLRPYLADVDGVSPKVAMVAGTQFVLAHEIGHAMVDKLDIPVTGREEDAVDGFAAYLLSEHPDFGPGPAFASALVFDALASNRGRDLAHEDFADEHSISEQRVYNFLCWLYGSDPKTFRVLVRGGVLPEQRAVRCSNEWDQIQRSWDRLLQPYAVPVG